MTEQIENYVKSLALWIGVSEPIIWIAVGVFGMIFIKKVFRSLGFVVSNDALLSNSTSKQIRGGSKTTTIKVSQIDLDTTGASQINMTLPGQSISLDDEVTNKLRTLLKEGNKIEAIKVIREISGMSLLEAKKTIEALEIALLRSGI